METKTTADTAVAHFSRTFCNHDTSTDNELSFLSEHFLQPEVHGNRRRGHLTQHWFRIFQFVGLSEIDSIFIRFQCKLFRACVKIPIYTMHPKITKSLYPSYQ